MESHWVTDSTDSNYEWLHFMNATIKEEQSDLDYEQGNQPVHTTWLEQSCSSSTPNDWNSSLDVHVRPEDKINNFLRLYVNSLRDQQEAFILRYNRLNAFVRSLIESSKKEATQTSATNSPSDESFRSAAVGITNSIEIKKIDQFTHQVPCQINVQNSITVPSTSTATQVTTPAIAEKPIKKETNTTVKNNNGETKAGPKSRPKFRYSHDQIIKALEAVEQGKMSKRMAAKVFGVPKSTLLDKLTGRTPRERRMGPHPKKATGDPRTKPVPCKPKVESQNIATKEKVKAEPKSRPKFQYSHEQLIMALEAVEKGLLSKRKASKVYGVPKSTLLDKLTGKTPRERRMGPLPYLTQVEEQQLVEWVKVGNEKGLPPHKDEILDFVQQMIKAVPNRKTPFKDDRPGRYWWQGFLKRHQELYVRTAK